MRSVIQPTPSLAGTVALLQSAGLPVSDLTTAHLNHFFYSGSPAAPDGVVGLELYGTQALLRSLVVAPTLRSAGLGSALLEHAESYARGAGVHAIFLLTATAESFFSSRGYVLADRATAPESIRNSREYAYICPASCALMVKVLD